MELKIKILTFFIVPYLFFCAGLYQLAFYSPFDVNIFSFLDVSDIIKSVVSPFLVSSSIALFSIMINFPTHNMVPFITGEKQFFENRYLRAIGAVIVFAYPLFVILYAHQCRDDRWKGLALPWLFVPIIYYVAITILHQLKLSINNKYTAFAIYFLVILPVICYESASKNAKTIYENSTFDYSSELIENRPLKFLGKASSHYIFTTFDNKERYFFETNKLTGLHLKHFSKK